MTTPNMKLEIRKIDEKRGMMQVTIADERWYINEEEKISVPSVTWISSYYYTSPYLIKWIADKGLDEAEAVKVAAGDKGSRVHKAIDMWLDGVEIKIDTKIMHDGLEQELSAEENVCFKSFLDWYQETKPKIIGHDYVLYGDGYGGTVDIKCEIDGELGILDLKTSQAVYKGHELQISAYKHADPDKDKIQKLWILQIGYRRNEKKFKLNEVEDKFKLFLNAKETWTEENKDATPKYIEFPLTYPSKEAIDKSDAK